MPHHTTPRVTSRVRTAVALGLTALATAGLLGIAEATVKAHLTSFSARSASTWSATSRRVASAAGCRRGWYEPPD